MAFLIDFETTGAESKLSNKIYKNLEAIANKANEVSSELSKVSGVTSASFKNLVKDAKKVIDSNNAIKSNTQTTAKSVSNSWREASKSFIELAKQQETAQKALQRIVTQSSKAKVDAWAKSMKQAEQNRKAYFSAEKAVIEKLKDVNKLAASSSLASVKSYYSKRLVIVKEALAKEIELQKKVASQAKIASNLAEVKRVSALGGTGSGISGLAQAEANIKATQSTKQLNAALESNSKKSAKAAKGAKTFAKSANYAAQETAAFRAALNAAGTHMGIFTSSTIITASAVYGTVSAFKSMITVGTQFTGEMVRALAIMNATSDESNRLTNEVTRLAESTIFTGTETAAGLTALAMSGMDATQALNALGPALNLASIGQIDMYRSADILTNVMLGFQLTALDTEKIVDDLSTAITSSNSTIEQMGTALSYVAPIASAAGASIEETIGILELFHNVGIKGSRAGTSLRRAFSNLLKPNEQASKTLMSMNVAVTDVSGNMRSLTSIMKDLAINGATTADIITLFGVRAAPAMQAFLDDVNRAVPQVDEFTKALKDNEGAAEDLRQKIEDTLGADALKLLSALQKKAIDVFTELEPSIRNALNVATEWVKTLDATKISDFLLYIKDLAVRLKEVAQAAVILGAALAIGKTIKMFYGGLQFIGLHSLKASRNITKLAGTIGLIPAASKKATKSLRALRFAIKGVMAATGVGLAIAVGSELILALYEWATATDVTIEKQRLLREELKKTNEEKLRQSKLLQEKAKPINAISNISDKELKRLETVRINAFNDLQKAKSAVIDMQGALTFMEAAKESGDLVTLARAKAYLLEQTQKLDLIKEATKKFEEAQANSIRYQTTGLSPAAIKNIQQANDELSKLFTSDYGDAVSQSFKELQTTLKEIKNLAKRGDITLVEELIGSADAISIVADSLEKEFKTQLQPVLDDIVKFDPNLLGKWSDKESWLEAIKKANDLTLEYKGSLEKLNQELLKSESSFAAYLNSNNDFISTQREKINQLVRETDKINGVADSTKSLEVARIEERLSQLKTIEIGLIGIKGREDELEAIRSQISALDELRVAREEAEANKVVATERKTLKDKFDKGEGLSAADKAQQEYDAQMMLLEQYIEIGLLKSEEDERYVEAKLEADQRLLESQNELWTQFTDMSAESIADNISKAALLDQTWEDTTKNIKRAIIGGIVGSLTELAIKKLSMLALSKMMATEEIVTTNMVAANEVAAEGIKATAKVAAETTKATAVTTTAAVEEATASSSIATTLAELLPAGAAVAAAWAPAAWMVSIATFGANTVPAMGGMAASAGLMAGLAVMLAAAGALSGTREIGGPVRAGESYLVGEKGAEIFTPSTGGAITSNADIKRMSSTNSSSGSKGDTYIVYEGDNISIKAVDTQSFRQAIARDSQYIASITDKEKRKAGISTNRRG